MIKIFNKKLDIEIYIDDAVDWVKVNPRDYEEIPYVSIELNNFNFFEHTEKCSFCKTFIEAFGSETLDWLFSYNNKIFRIDMKKCGNQGYANNRIINSTSDYFQGTKINLVFHVLPIEKNELIKLLDLAIEKEDYEKACILRDLIIK